MPDEQKPDEAAEQAALSKNDDDDFESAFAAFADGDAADSSNDDVADHAADSSNDDVADHAADSVVEKVSENETNVENNDNNESESEVDRLRSENEQLQHKFRSNDGRIAAYQRRIDELQEQVSAKAGTANDGDDDQKAADGDELDAFRKEYPEIAGPLETMRTRDQKQIEQLTATVAALTGDQRQNQLDKQESILADAHPDWEGITGDGAFRDWVGAQPLYVQQAARRNGEKITNGQEAAHLIASFKASLPQYESSDSDAKEVDKAAEAEKSDQQKTLRGKRQRQLESGASVQSKGPGAASGPPDDYDAAFDFFARKKS